ncbi:class I SAM-dependent methyltransferase [Chitinimonas lacunae]|uniref:Class I SAM-dependent methyltransferase n=1 Tax=Chitinimonas lacunae TaxID=1963018 RepID=A0ABV8MM99_9NEIS
MPIRYHIDSFTIFEQTLVVEGWLFADDGQVVMLWVEHPNGARLPLDYGGPSDDVVQALGPAARDCRFRYRGRSPFTAEDTSALVLHFQLADGRVGQEVDFIRTTLLREPIHQLVAQFLHELSRQEHGQVVELGARARSGVTRRHLIPPRFDYLGVDVLPGPNVDLVADAHALSRYLPPASVEAVFSFSVFEHLLMPWKVAVELNRVMRPGGLGLIVTHQAWPVHDAPCDYWRFSATAWRSLFNRATGFAILDARVSDPAYLVPKVAFTDRITHQSADNFQQSAVLFRKIGETRLDWEVEVGELDAGQYPV